MNPNKKHSRKYYRLTNREVFLVFVLFVLFLVTTSIVGRPKEILIPQAGNTVQQTETKTFTEPTLLGAESGCVSKVGFTAATGINYYDPNYHVFPNVGKSPGRIQDKMREMMNCAFPSQNWNNTQINTNGGPAWYTQLPDVSNPNGTYPYRPYQALATWHFPDPIIPLPQNQLHNYRFLALIEPEASYEINLIDPEEAVLWFVKWTNQLAGKPDYYQAASRAEIPDVYCCGNHSWKNASPNDNGRKWMAQFLCHLSGQQSCAHWETNQPVTTPQQLRGSNGAFLKYLAGYHWHILNGHSTATEWSNRLTQILDWIDDFQVNYASLAALPNHVVISETGAPLDQYWGQDNIYDKINIVFQRRNEPRVESILWNTNFVFDDIYGTGAGISTQSGLFSCADCAQIGNNGTLRLTDAGQYFRQCLKNNGTCPNPDTYAPPREIGATVGNVTLSTPFRAGVATTVQVSTSHTGAGSWFESVKWKYISPSGTHGTINTCSPTGCTITPDASKAGWKIAIMSNIQQTDPTNSNLKHICARASGTEGQWTVVNLPNTGVVGIPYDNPNSLCKNTLYTEYVVAASSATPICPTMSLTFTPPVQRSNGQWTITGGESLASFPVSQIPPDRTTGLPASGWARVSKRTGSTYTVVCSSAKIQVVTEGSLKKAKGKPSPNQCTLAIDSGVNSQEFRVEAVFSNVNANGSSLTCPSQNFTITRL